MRLTSRRSQPPLALSVIREVAGWRKSRVGGGSAFFVRRISHATLESHRGSRRQLGHAIFRRHGFCSALPLDVASADSVATIFVLVHLICHVWRLAHGFADSIFLGVVRHGVAGSFLFGIGCAICYGGIGLELASPPHFVIFPSERIYCEYRLQQRDDFVGYMLDR